jgi:REP element-mobilizing transposase RayT
MPNHAHLIIGRRRLTIEKTCDQLKARASKKLTEAGMHPFSDQPYADGRLPTPWARKGWWVFINDAEHLSAAISYVEKNPVKSGLKPQRWSFVKPVGEG